jgi:hypothetical protein
VGSASWPLKANSAARSLRLPNTLVALWIVVEEEVVLDKRAERTKTPSNISAVIGLESACSIVMHACIYGGGYWIQRQRLPTNPGETRFCGFVRPLCLCVRHTFSNLLI